MSSSAWRTDARPTPVAALHQRLELRGRHPPARRGAHDLASAEHGRGLQLDENAVGVVLEARVVEAQDLPRRVIAPSERLGELGGAPTPAVCMPFSRRPQSAANDPTSPLLCINAS